MSKRLTAILVTMLFALPTGMALAADELTPEDLLNAPQVIEEGVVFYIPGPCCASLDDCPKVTGYRVACGGGYCDGDYTCMYWGSTGSLDIDAAEPAPADPTLLK